VGHVELLRRQSVQPFPAERMVTIEALQAALEAGQPLPLISPSEAVGHLPMVTLAAAEARRLQQGQTVSAAGATLGAIRASGGSPPEPEATVRVHGSQGQFLGLGRLLSDGRLAPKRLVAQPLSE
jgi:tRNA pseudouridine55 synthase